MRSSILLLSAAAASTVCALPNLSRRDEKVWDANGNIKLTFSKQTVQVGTVKIDDMFDRLVEICHESGQCETNDIELEGQLIAPGRGGSVDNIKVILGPDGEYPTWIRNGLVDALRAAVKSISKCEDITHTNDCAGTTAMAYCPEHKITVNECEVPAYWGINYQAPDSANAAPPNIGVNVAMEFVDDEICQNMLDALGAVAGAVNGVAGGIFSLLSFACQ